MTIDPIAQALHHKSCRGGMLTPEEQTRLQQWYAKMDEEEAEMFARAEKRHQEEMDLLQNRIDATNAKIVEEATKIQALEQENQRIRTEIAKLERQLIQTKARQPV